MNQAHMKALLFFNLALLGPSCAQRQSEDNANSMEVMKPNVEEYLGKTVIMGVSLYGPSGRWLKQMEIHGRITEISEETGMVLVLLDSGREFHASPDLSALQKAAPGLYRSHATEQEIENPDFISLWKVTLSVRSKSDDFEWGTGARWERGADIKFPK